MSKYTIIYNSRMGNLGNITLRKHVELDPLIDLYSQIEEKHTEISTGSIVFIFKGHCEEA